MTAVFVLRFCTSLIICQRIDISTWREERLTLSSMSYTVLVTEECKARVSRSFVSEEGKSIV